MFFILFCTFAIVRMFHNISLMVWELPIYNLSLLYSLPVLCIHDFLVSLPTILVVCHEALEFKPSPGCFIKTSFYDILPTIWSFQISSIPNGNPFETNRHSCCASFQILPTLSFSFHHFLKHFFWGLCPTRCFPYDVLLKNHVVYDIKQQEK